LKQNEKSYYVEISGIISPKKKRKKTVENVVHDITYTLEIDLNLFDIENVYCKDVNNQNLDKPLI